MNRCKWCNINNPKYIDYHDNEWGKLKTDDNYLFEMLILETFQIGLSWECVLNKREAFKKAYNNFDLDKVCNYFNYPEFASFKLEIESLAREHNIPINEVTGPFNDYDLDGIKW